MSPPEPRPAGEVLPPRVRRAMLLRSLTVQASFNYRTLIGTGLAYVLAPALRYARPGGAAAGGPGAADEGAARHAGFFNSHPYLLTVAAGALVRAEHDGAPPETMERFKTALRGSLGTLGDRLVWLRWRPAAALLGVALLLAGAPWWLGCGAFLLVHNALHLWLRVWGLGVGLRDGLGVARALRDAPFQRLGDRAADAGAMLSGFAAVRMVGQAAATPLDYGLGAVALAAGVLLGARVRPVATAALVLVLAAGLVLVRTL